MTIDKNIFIKNIYYMLAYAFKELRRNSYDNIAAEEFENVYQLLAEILVRGVSYQLKQGLHREYVPVSESLTTVKGRVNVFETIRMRCKNRSQLVCDHDELSENCMFNRIIKTTLELLLERFDLRADQKKALRNLLPFFSEVESIDPKNIRWSYLRFDRSTRSYRMLMYICFFVLDDKLLSTDDGEYRLNSFSDERMCRLFEKFILEYYRKEHPETNARSKQISWNIDESKSDVNILPILQSDVYLTIRNRTLIIDAKYYSRTMQSRFDKRTIHSGNLNQILVYVLNEDGNRAEKGSVDGMLLYAKTDEEIVPDGKMIWSDGNVISFKTLDLNREFQEIRMQLDAVVAG